MAEYTDADLKGSRFWRVDLSGSRLHGVLLQDVKITDAWVNNLDVSGMIGRLVVNEVDVTAFVREELDKRHPERRMLRATDVEGLRAAWALIEERADATLQRARALPPASLDVSVDEEYSYLQTLRHLVMGTDRWITGPVFGDPEPFHPLGWPTDDPESGRALGLDIDATPTLDEVLAVRAQRMASVAELLRDASPADLTRTVASPNGGTTSVMACIHVVLGEEWAHDRFANRDLDKLAALHTVTKMPTVVEAAARVRAGTQSAEELVRACLDAVERDNGRLNAFVHVDAEMAVTDARAVDAAVRDGRTDDLGPLAGVPFGVKDLEDCAGMPTTRGSRWFAGGPPKEADSLHVGRLRAAGAIPIGKTAAPEFGAWAYTASPLLGVTRNPWDPSVTPGGSSGGSTAAVSAGMIPFGTASDGGGSIRGPAAFTGLVGLRPSYGRIPTFGDTHLAQNAVVGSVTTTVADTALLLDVMAGPDARDRTCLPAPPVGYLDSLEQLDLSGLRVAWSADLGFAVVDPEVATVCEQAARAVVAATGADLVDTTVTLDDYTLTYAFMEGVDKFVGIDPDLWEHRLDELDPLSAPGWGYLSQRTLPWQAAVEDDRRRLVQQVAALYDDVDLLLMPMASIPPFAAEGPMPTEINGQEVHGGMSVVLGFLASLVNLPAISVPAGLTQAGLPVGLQIVGPRHREDLVLATAAAYEQARPWPRHCP